MLNVDVMSKKITFASLSKDNYLRVFKNEEFQTEVRPFARIKYTKTD